MTERLEHRWQQINHQLTDTGARFDFDWPSLWQSLPPQQQQQLRKVLLVSQYVVDALPKDSDYFVQQLQSNQLSQPVSRADIGQWLHDLNEHSGQEAEPVPTTGISEEQWLHRLRILRRRVMVQTIWRDLLRLADTLTTTRTVSDLADEVICQSIRYFEQQLQQRYGVPMGKASGQPQSLLVLGMGKLGAYELNLSSDIDLIFSYPESGQTNGKKSISNQEYFVKLGQKLIGALDKHTIDGFVFRTDMRLRPYGQSGPLVMNFDSLEEYYQNQGRDWERYAMVKARILTGEDTPAAQELLAILRPFTYRVYIDYSAFESLRSMKAMINAEVRRRRLDDNVKLGPGGIREVEFIVQAFQLIRGGQEKQLQQRALVPLLNILIDDGYLPADAAHELRDAYLYLRDVEHALQALNDEQTQQLPTEAEAQDRIALALDCDHWDAVVQQLSLHRSHVKHHFANIVCNDDDEQPNDSNDHIWVDVWHGDLADEAHTHLSHHCPVMLTTEFSQCLANFRHSRAVSSMQAIGHDRLETLMPQLLYDLSQCPEPLNTLQRLIPLLEAVLRRTAYLVLLKENPQARTQLVQLCGASEWVAHYITQMPLLLDELLNPATLYHRPQRHELQEELQLRLLRIDQDDLEQQMEALRQFVHAHKLRAAAGEVMNALPLMHISDYLTWIAEVVLDNVMQLAWQQMTNKYGYPANRQGDAVTKPEFIIVGYGKVGGLEMSYSSDLDLVFLHNSWNMGSTQASPAAGQRSIDNNVFYTRMGQRMIHILTTQTRSGDLYEVDMRLRPSGNSGMIVASLKAFEEYQAHHAWTWEHQALVRARVLCGNPELAAAYNQIRRQTLTQPRPLPTLKEEVRSMRKKMRENLGMAEKSADKFHLKQDAGGIVDIEFLVQYGVLAWSHQYPDLLAVTDNMRLLDSFETVGLLDSQDRQTLQETYLTYRAETHRRALQNTNLILDQTQSQQLGFDERREGVTRLWKLWIEN
ncbi:bifunctional [glutamate--ammonia ligase]-adenylyl-L-tyrosine phosphorylase/[glutamate--ammonia-ligase] adenylyltransferase [Oceanobacter sp. 3_MG-2023]|uniref:bifunctional [glutamate--ammonia ligase]-adenylyl-L-tyrosine phosphorylase/[glutamate--ammonia-ligase] adenylyltransferase n=1 Tax=Oceanobacter sp. 3_MG-2023 TaxID=3062622 RepID=UPI0027329F25|nr:bifunctional [glutamate--ammonia ligase]-adenylyl-L-tyrosine phosphorylase/[glutamate--ammonia-ligase] adenylyltransferase [Oceanobacter sp. 3_MG-2023]MDP2504724.1 bifunctional [glutamate--ammonia ligase]-adenylyl-L-tyrosine phosphorylase/[glutamate--ammonia-ligase] adenylyltransferase [Oceanobacter sp. 3_MG-2023]